MTVKKLAACILLIFFISPWPVNAVDEGIDNLRETGKAFASVARKVSPSVVFIQVESRAADSSITQFSSPFGEFPFGDDLFKRFFGDQFPGRPRFNDPQRPQNERRAQGQGSGFVFASENGLLSDKTYIMTNSHVVEGADNISVKFKDGREYNAKVTGSDPQSDVAVIEIETDEIPALGMGNSSELEVGEWVVAIGNPFGLSYTLTVGVVSAKGRTSIGINDYEDFIQTDAAINPGNSGGPLVNLEGEVVGINTAIFSRSGGHMGIGFAIPIDLAKTIANQLIEKGEVTRGHLGIMIQPLTADLAESFDVEPGKGILVAQVSKNSPAEKAGLRQGDIIVAYRGKPVVDVGRFRNRISLTPPGSTERLTVMRNGKLKELMITIGKINEETQVARVPSQSTDKIGLTVQTLTPQLAQQFDAEPGEGVVVTAVQPDSIASAAGIEVGSIILQVNRKPIKSAKAFQKEVGRGSKNKHLLLLVRENGNQRFVALSW